MKWSLSFLYSAALLATNANAANLRLSRPVEVEAILEQEEADAAERSICLHDLFPTCQDLSTPDGAFAGIMCFTVDANELKVNILASEAYLFVRYKFWLGENTNDMPVKEDKSPDFKKFPHYWSDNEGEKSAVWELDVAKKCPEDGSDLVVSVVTHAIVGPVAEDGNVDRDHEVHTYAGQELSHEVGYFDLTIHCNCPEEL